MQKALESLPWVRKAEINFAAKQATVTVESKAYKPAELARVLKQAGFGGKVALDGDKKEKAQPLLGKGVTFRVDGMKKTKSGAT